MVKNHMGCRVRFAPSPTGFLHIGGVRTALYNWLYARRQNGQFLLRIEDTDLERSEKQYTDDILASLKWLGLDWDEPEVYQSRNVGKHHQRVIELINSGHAYRCVCTPEQVEKMRETAMAQGQKPMYDRRCRELGLPDKGAFVVRAKVPLTGETLFTDLIHGTIRYPNKDIDDFVLLRSGGAPTYNLSVVIDDVDMKITDVIRGDDHLNNTPKQVFLYQSLGEAVPRFAHLSMILGPDKKKLSKRHGAVSAGIYRSEGYLPDALLNFLVRLGWSHGDQEVFHRDELVKFFTFDNVQKSSAVFNPEKLDWLNGVHMREKTPQQIVELLKAEFSDRLIEDVRPWLNDPDLHQVVTLLLPKVKKLTEVVELLNTLYKGEPPAFDVAQMKWSKNPALKQPILAAVKAFLDYYPAHAKSLSAQKVPLESLGVFLESVMKDNGIKMGDLFPTLRAVVSGPTVGVGVLELLHLLPWNLVRSRVLRLNQA